MSTESPREKASPAGVTALRERRRPAVVRPRPTAAIRANPPPGDGLDWARIFGAVRRFKWIVLGVMLLGTATGFVAGGFMDPIYRARATIWIEVPDVRTRDQGPIQSGQLIGSSGWVDLLKSHNVVYDVVRERRLYLSTRSREAALALGGFRVSDAVRAGSYRVTVNAQGTEFTLATAEGDALQTGKVGEPVGADLGFVWTPTAADLPARRTIEFSVSSPITEAQRLADRIRVQTDLMDGKVGNFMRIEMRGANPSRITLTINAVAERFVAVAADLKKQKITELVGILGEQVARAQSNLVATEQALRAFRVGAVTVFSGDGSVTGGPPARDPAFTNFFDMKVTREQLRRDIATLGEVLAGASDSTLGVETLEMTAAVERSSALKRGLEELADAEAELRTLRFHYTDDHPPVRRLAERVRTLRGQTIPARVGLLAEQLRAREAALTRQIDSVAGGLRQIPPLAIEEARLRRDLAFAEQLFADLRQRHEEARLAEVSSIPEVRILDRAVEPQAPLFDGGPMLVGIALLGSALLGVLGAVVLDRVDPRVRYPAQVTEAMGLSILGVVPHVSRGNGTGGDVAPVIESLRGVRLRVVHAHGAVAPCMLTVTSPARGEGKSFVASNLALAFAQAGFRTLLIDGDVRRGVLHRVLKCQRKPGLTEVLAGTVGKDDVVHATSHRSLWFIGGGARTQMGPELLASAAMEDLIASLRPSYDAILIDSPPLAAGADAYALATMTGSLLFVLRTGFSDRAMAEAKLDVLDRLPVRVLGAVLNDVRLGGEYRYYSYYMAGYEVTDEESSWVGRPVLRAPE